MIVIDIRQLDSIATPKIDRAGMLHLGRCILQDVRFTFTGLAVMQPADAIRYVYACHVYRNGTPDLLFDGLFTVLQGKGFDYQRLFNLRQIYDREVQVIAEGKR